MDTSNPAPEPKTKKPRHRINYALAATLVMQGATLADVAKQVGAKSAGVLRVGLARKGVTATDVRKLEPIGERNVSVTHRLASQASDIIRERFGDQLAKTTDQLAKLPLRATYKSLRQRADLLEPLARTAKIVCGWSDDTKSGAVDLTILHAVRVEFAPQPVVSSVPIQGEVIDITPQDSESSPK